MSYILYNLQEQSHKVRKINVISMFNGISYEWNIQLNSEYQYKSNWIELRSLQSYRPLCVLTFRLNYLIHGISPMGYHIVNVVLHVIVCLIYNR